MNELNSCTGCNQPLSAPSSLSSAHHSFSDSLCSSCTLKKLLVLLRRGNVVCDCCGKFYRPNRRREMSRFFCSTCETSFNKLSREELKADINQVCPYRKIKRDSGSADENCCLCLESYTPGEYKRVLTCGHIFHKKCIDQWFLKDKTELEDCTCPLCRAPLAHKRRRTENQERLPSVDYILNQSSEEPPSLFTLMPNSDVTQPSVPAFPFYIAQPPHRPGEIERPNFPPTLFSPALPPITTPDPTFVFNGNTTRPDD